jgi:signal peptidase I
MNSIFQYFDLELVLVLATLVSGVIVLLDRYWLRPARLEKKLSTEPWYVDYSLSFFPVLIIVLICAPSLLSLSVFLPAR